MTVLARAASERRAADAPGQAHRHGHRPAHPCESVVNRGSMVAAFAAYAGCVQSAAAPSRPREVTDKYHSKGAMVSVQSGVPMPPSGIGKQDYAELQRIVADARAALPALTRETANAMPRTSSSSSAAAACHSPPKIS